MSELLAKKQPNGRKQLKGERILEVKKLLKERYNKINNILDSIDYNKISLEEDCLPFIFNNGTYILRNGKIIHGEQVDQTIYYYYRNCHLFDTVDYKKPLPILDRKEKKDNLVEKVCTDIISEEDLLGLEDNDGMHLSFNNQNLPHGKYSYLYFINNHFFVQEHIQNGYSSIYHRGMRNMSYKTVYYEINDVGEKDENTVYESLKDIRNKFSNKKYSYYKQNSYSREFTSVTDKTKKMDSENNVVKYSHPQVYFYENKFYIGNTYLYELETKKLDNMYYAVYKDFFIYYVNKETKDAIKINPIYSTTITLNGKDYNIMLCNGKLTFKEKPYHKYGIVKDKSIVLKDKLYTIDLDSLKYDSNSNSVYSDKYEIIKEFEEKDKFFLIDKYFITVKDNKVYVYYKIASISTNNVLTNKCKNYRFKRKKSNFYLNTNTNDILVLDDSDECYILKSSNYNISSLKLIKENAATIEDKNNRLFCINSKGLIVTIEPLKNYKEFDGQNSIVGIKDNGEVYFNGITFNYKDESLYYKNKKILPNVKYKGNFKFYSAEAVDNADSGVYIGFADYKDGRVYDELTAEPLFCNEFIDCYDDNRGNYVYLIKEDIELSLSCKIKEVKEHPLFIALKNQYIIHGYHIISPILDKIILLNSYVYDNICKKVEGMSFNNKQDLQKSLDSIMIRAIMQQANDFGILISEKDIRTFNNQQDLITVILNIENILSHSVMPENILLKDITTFIKNDNYDFTKSNFYISQNRKNTIDFISKGLSVDRFNNYEKNLNFKATTAENGLFKSSLGSSLFTQFYNLIGSRIKKIEGALQLNSIDYLSTIEEDINRSISHKLNRLTDTEKLTIVKNLNKLGYKIHSLLKKYNISMDYINSNIVVNNIDIDKVPLKKITAIASDLIEMKDKLLNMLQKYLNDERFSEIKDFLSEYISWSIKHIEDDFSNIPTDIKNVKEKEFSIKLWNRSNLIENLVQGNKTHCCLATDNFNIKAMIEYIYNNNIIILEIKNKEKTIGQAFVYLAVTEKEISYRFQHKKHIFMIIDNVEINNNYANYTNDIAIHLQNFIIEYKNYVSKNISDVLLGTSYNDIVPPYSFKTTIKHNSIGTPHYTDNGNEFYKFI